MDPRGLKVALISHAYLEKENLKYIEVVNRLVALIAYVPRRGQVTLFAEASAATGRTDVVPRRAWRFRNQLLFWPPLLGLGSHRPDLIHVDYPPWSVPFWQAAVAARLTRRRVVLVCTVKKNTYRPYRGLPGLVKGLLATTGFRVVDAVEASSEIALAMLLKHFPEVARKPVAVVTHMGVDVSHFRPRLDNETDEMSAVRVGYAGRIDGDKAIMLLIDAVERCRQSLGTDIRLDLLGDGQGAAAIEAKIARCEWVRLLRPVPASYVSAFLQSLDIFVLPSRVRRDHEEHDAHALLQAAACGLPTVATRSGINPEIVRRGVGLLISPDDLPELESAIMRLVVDRDLRLELGSQARRAATDGYSIESVARERASFYARAMEGKRSQHAG